MSDRLLPAEQGDRNFFGRTYHWHRVNGVLSLRGGRIADCIACTPTAAQNT